MEPPSFWYDRNFFASVEEALDFVRELLAVDVLLSDPDELGDVAPSPPAPQPKLRVIPGGRG
ncbi:hypothetical protein [Defluviicoccus vanus]|uniref:Uncharacterized protein n=1 Tax=Defluviicoccus vanus TaxID=111831 RepID=A0A7H1N713_9PROT|nr:hypothetical protein [Defluviicoccus vanus]QNT71499.1 hypothetical protein HQ394_19405 [Defluviicoccus vanus]